MQAARPDDREFQAMVALVATGLLVLVMLVAPNARSEGLSPELIFAGMPLVICLAWLYPVEVALVFVAATMFRIHEAYPFLIPYRLPLVTAFASILAVTLHIVVKNTSLPAKLELKLALLFGVHVTLGIAFSVDREQSLMQWTENFGKLIAGMVFLAMILRLPRDAMKIAVALITASVLVSFVAIYNSLNGIGFVNGDRVTIAREMGSLLGDPNDLCFVLMFPVSFALGTLLTRGTGIGLKLACACALPIMAWAIIATQSRGGVLSVVAVCGYFFVRSQKSKLFAFAITGTLGVLLYVVAGIGRRGYAFSQTETLDLSSHGRIAAWIAAVRMALVYPIFGVGMGNFVGLYWNYSDFWDGQPHATHSIWFQVLSEAGFVGLGLYVWMIVASLCSAYRSNAIIERNKAPGSVRALSVSIVASWIGICVAGSFLSQAFSWQIFILVALTAVLSRHADSYAAADPALNPAPSRVGVALSQPLLAAPRR